MDVEATLATIGVLPQLRKLDELIDSARNAIEYEGRSPDPDMEQLRYLWARVDKYMNYRAELDLEISQANPMDDGWWMLCDALMEEIFAPDPSPLTLLARRLRDAFSLMCAGFRRLADKLWKSIKAAVRPAWAGLRRMLLGRRRGTERPSRAGGYMTPAPPPLAPEQAPGAISGAIRAEVRWTRRFL